MKNKNKNFNIIAALFMTLSSFVYAGVKEAGGGDPNAIEFIEIGDSISDFLATSNMFPEFDSRDFKTALKNIRSSLDNGKNNPKIKFQNTEIVCAGTTKIGCVFSDNTILIDRLSWNKLDKKEKIELVSLELLQVLNFTERYSVAQSIGSYSDEIQKTKIQGLSCMTIATERALKEARRSHPKYMAMVPTKASYIGIEEVGGLFKNKYEINIQVTTSDDYTEDLIFEYKFIQKNCIN